MATRKPTDPFAYLMRNIGYVIALIVLVSHNAC